MKKNETNKERYMVYIKSTVSMDHLVIYASGYRVEGDTIHFFDGDTKKDVASFFAPELIGIVKHENLIDPKSIK